MSKTQQIIDFLGQQKEELLYLQRELTARPALGPTNQGQGEKEKADFLLDYLQKLGTNSIQQINAPDERVPCGYRPNIAAKIAGKNPDKTLWIMAHMDVVPPGDSSLWSSNPYELKVEGDTIYGRGVEDNQQGMVSSLLVAFALQKLHIKPDINLGLLLVADEETGNEFGLRYVLEHSQNIFSEHDLFLVPDFGSFDSKMIEVAEKSSLWLKFIVEGKQCHASTPDQGINSLIGASALILKLDELHSVFDKKDDLFRPPISTFVPSKKEANVPNVNTLPGKDIFYLDCRILPGYDLQEIQDIVSKLAKEVSEQYGVKINFEPVQEEQAAPPTDIQSEVVVLLEQAIQKIYNVQAQPAGIGGGTVAALLRRKGYAAAVWSTLLHQAHQPNEKSSITNTLKDAQVMAELLFAS